jgi:heptosyltransferase-1
VFYLSLLGGNNIMRVLLIKTSSLGDIIHTLPAITDASLAIPNIQFDWVIEEAFAELPILHSHVAKIIPVALRRLRKKTISPQTWREWIQFYRQLHERDYDLILDAQGLMKSACMAYLAKGKRAGLDFRSARESFASLFYQKKYSINFYQHAIVRMRNLFSLSLNYSLPSSTPDIGLQFKTNTQREPYLVFLHGTTWQTKEWPENYWCELAELINKSGLKIKISGVRPEEIARAKRIAFGKSWVEVLPSLSILQMGELLANAHGVVAVDTGFGHLAAALNVPVVSMYGPTHPEYTGAIGNHAINLTSSFVCTPCFKKTCQYRKPMLDTPACFTMIPPARVWFELRRLMQSNKVES